MKTLLTIMSIFLGLTVQGQNPYYDALKLREYIVFDSVGKPVFIIPDPNNQQQELMMIEYCEIINTGYYDGVLKTPKQVHLALSDKKNKHYNPFLSEYLTGGGVLSSNESRLSGGKISKLISKVGGLDVTNIANGISQFMIERAKEELTVAFFNKFKAFAEKHEEFEVLFPKTTDNLGNLLEYHYPEMLPALRSGFLDDIKSITYHLDDVFELPRYKELLDNFPEVRVTIRSIRLVHELESGESHPADVLLKFSTFPEWKAPSSSIGFKNFGNSVSLASIFSNSLRHIDYVEKIKASRIEDTLRINTTIMTLDPVKNEHVHFIKGTIFFKVKSVAEGIEDRDSVITVSDTVRTAMILGAESNSRKGWVTFDQMKMLVTDPITFRIYLGLLYQQVNRDSIRFHHDGDTVLFTSIMADHRHDLFLFENKVTEFVELANRADKILDTLAEKKIDNVSLTHDELYSYIDVSLDVIDYGFSIAKVFSVSSQTDDYTMIARKCNDLYRNIYKEEYTQAINNAVDVLKTLRNMVHDNSEIYYAALQRNHSKIILAKPLDKLSKKDIALMTENFGTSISPLTLDSLRRVGSAVSTNQLMRVIERTSKYGLFMANLVNAQSGEEVSDVLESAVLPVGSSSIKKNSGFNIGIQSYLGGFARLGSEEEGNISNWGNPAGVMAPIGVAFSAGLPKKLGSATLFTSLFDLGAIVDYQLSTRSVPTSGGMDSIVIERDYSVKLGQIFSPGAYFVWGLPWNIPLSIGFGTQYGPGLGRIENNSSAIVSNPFWRTNAFLAVDIPFFNLVNVPKRYRPD